MVVIFCGQKLSHLLSKFLNNRVNIANLKVIVQCYFDCNCNHYICFQEVIGIVMITIDK